MGETFYLGIAKSMKPGDNRVSIPPNGIPHLFPAAWNNGRDQNRLEIIVEKGAGDNAGFTDEEYEAAGATIVDKDTLLKKSEILVDLKQRPREGVIPGRVHMFYAHVEKGQGIKQLKALLEAGNITAYSPETFWVKNARTGANMRGCNLGYFSGIGGVHLMLQGIKLSYEARGETDVPFVFFPNVEGATDQDIAHAYQEIGDLEHGLRFAILGGPTGMVSSGAQAELARAGLSCDVLYKDITKDPDKLAEAIAQYDGIMNATVWNNGGPRIITKQHISAMREGLVFVDNTCDVDESSTIDSEGGPVIGGVRYTFESNWGDPNIYYWVGTETHTFKDNDPLKFLPGEVRAMYSAVGMIPGGTTTAKAASEAYFGMIFPYLTSVIRAVSQGSELPENGLVVKKGRIHHPDLRELVQTRDDLEMFRPYL